MKKPVKKPQRILTKRIIYTSFQSTLVSRKKDNITHNKRRTSKEDKLKHLRNRIRLNQRLKLGTLSAELLRKEVFRRKATGIPLGHYYEPFIKTLNQKRVSRYSTFQNRENKNPNFTR